MSSKRNLLLGIAAIAVTGLALYAGLRDGSRSADNAPAIVAQADMKKTSQTGAGESVPSSPETGNSVKHAEVDVSRLIYDRESFKGATLPQRLSEMSARRNGRAFDPEQVADALKSDVAWSTDSTAPDKLPLTAEEKRDGREFIHMNPLKIEALVPGDEMSLPIAQVKQTGTLRMVVDSVENNGDGNLTWHGHLKDYDSENQVTFTRGDSLIVGGVTVPDKNFVVQVRDDVGWVANGFTLFRGKHDAIKPPRN